MSHPEYLWRDDKKVPLGGKSYSHDLMAADALDFSFEDQIATTGAGEVRVAAVGDRSRALEVGTADGYEVTVYAQQDDLLVRVTTGAAAGDPTDDALAVIESILGRTG